MIAYHFPPLAGSSGIQRTLRFVQHLPALGWQPLVLSASPNAYERTSSDLLADVPDGTVVRRAFALDTARHLQIAGRYAGWMARPDRWVSWQFDAVRQGMKLIEEFKPDVIWSTYPIATAHVIASKLHRKTGIPWVADFRDPMAQDGYPADSQTWQSFKRIEQDAARQARFCVFTTPSAARIYQERYPNQADRMVVLENGYDEESFRDAGKQPETNNGTPANGRQLVMLHSGIIYPIDRNPTQLFMALSRLMNDRLISPSDIRIRFRAPVHSEFLIDLSKTYGVQDFIEICPAIPYRAALTEMLGADVLLVLQGSGCNSQIPAKIYEYLRAGKPILGLTDPLGDTAAVLIGAGLKDIAHIESVDEIAKAISLMLEAWRAGIATKPNPRVVQQASRSGRSLTLVGFLEKAIVPVN